MAITCGCYFCEEEALWQIALAGEDEPVEETYACERHARGHVHRAIVLPAHLSELLITDENARPMSPI